MSRLVMIAHAPTPALRQAVFGRDDDLDEGGTNAAAALRGMLGSRRSSWFCGPAAADLSTARQLGGQPQVLAELADADYGSWSGQGFAQVAATDPAGLQEWMSDPHAAPHGGESLAAVVDRVGARLDALAHDAGPDLDAVLVVAPGVVRAALVHALGLSAAAIWRIEVAPLAVTRLGHRGGSWRLHLTETRR